MNYRSFSGRKLLDIRKFLITASASVLLLSGCSTPTTEKSAGYDEELASETAVFSWTAKGKMYFSCAYDDAGFYWRFIRSDGILRDDKGRQMGVLRPDLSIQDRDGRVLKIAAYKTGEQKYPDGLKNLLYKVTSSPNNGLLKNMHYVERRNARGGLPLTQCSAVQKEQLLRVPFEARYIFWR